MIKKFWMVYRVGGNGPTHQHATLTSAMKEAERLATQVGGGRFFVLEAVAHVEERRFTTTWLDDGAELRFQQEEHGECPF